MKYTGSLLSYFGSFLLALSLAVIIWVTATQEQDPMRTQFLQVDLEFAGQPENSILIRPEDQSIQIRVEGPESVLNQISPNDFNAFVDLSQVPFGQSSMVPIEITTSARNIEDSIPIPDEIEVLIEEQVTRDIPVELDIRGGVARGHIQGDPLIDPPFITVVGPASSVEQLDFALATVFLNEARETNVGEHRPIFYDQRGRVASTSGLELSTEQIQVTIPVEESAGFADKLITVDWTGEPAPGYRILNVSVDPPSVLVEGLPARLNALTRLSTEPIDITGLTESFTQQAALELPAGVSLDQDQEIFVTIDIEPILTTDIKERDVEILGLSSDMVAATDPEQVRVVLFGPLAALDSLVDDDVRVTVDVFGLISGTHSLEPVVDIPERGVEVRSIRPGSVSVTLTSTLTSTEGITPTLPITQTHRGLLNKIASVIPQNPASNFDLTANPIIPIAITIRDLPLTPQFAHAPGKITHE